MVRGARLHSSLNRLVPLVCALVCPVCSILSNARATPANRKAQSAAPQQPSTQNQQQHISLDPGKLIEREIPRSQTLSFGFELAQKQYSSVAVDCGGKRADVTLYDTANTAISRYNTAPTSPKQTIEIAAQIAGHFRLDVKNNSLQGPAETCNVLLATPRSASEKELLLQQARELNFKASLLMKAGKFEEAEKPAEESLALRGKELEPDDSSVADSDMQLGRIFYFKGDYPKSESFYFRALPILEKTTGSVSLALGNLLSNIGTLYMDMGELDKAEQFLQRSLAIQEKLSSPDDPNPELAATMGNLGNVYYYTSNYDKAEQLYEREIKIEEKIFGSNSSEVADDIVNLGNVYLTTGDYVEAESRYRRALTIYQEALGPEDRMVGYPLQGLANVYYAMGDFTNAEPLGRRGLAIWEKTLGEEHPLVAQTLNTLGEIYRAEGDFKHAESLYQRSLAIRQKKLGNDHYDVAQSILNLGTLYRDQGDYARAEPLYQKALAIQEKALGPEHPDTVSTLFHMSTLQMAKGNLTEAEALLSRAITTSQRNVDLNLHSGSEHQKLAYLNLLSSQLNRALTLSAILAPEQPAARDLALTTLLQRKGLVQDVLSETFASLRQRMSPEDAELLDKLDKVTSRLARLVLGGPQQTTVEEHQRRVSALRAEREHLEAEISRRSAEFRAASQPATIQAVRAALPDNAVLLEFLTYKRFLLKGVTDKESFGESRYIVYVVHPSGSAQWKELGEAKALDDAIDRLRQALRDPNRGDVKQLARTVDEKVLQPLRGMIGDASHLLISPDGELDLIPFEALVDEQGRYGLERYSISYLTTGRDLLRMQVARESKSRSLIVADPSFGEPGGQQIAETGKTKEDLATPAMARRRSITTGENLSTVYFAPLSGTAREARTIEALFPEAEIRMGRQATKAALKQVEAPRLLHIATHGFFLLDAANNTTRQSPTTQVKTTRAISASAKIENPLLRSGLALAGANLNKGGSDDGILTALEASNLNLWGTKLVTLSACDTGVGEVKNGEGVYGLRRAFFLAGTESLVMSLWPVSDYVTRELMTEYYSGLKQGLGRGEALRKAQFAMLHRRDRQHPFYWASFIQSGEWANLDGQR